MVDHYPGPLAKFSPLWTEYNEVYEADIRILKEAQSLKERHVSLSIPCYANSVKKPEKVLI